MSPVRMPGSKRQGMQRMWTRIASICILSFIASCGGGGGGGQEPRPNFERVTIAGVPGVKDNRTGLVWASQLGEINPQVKRLPDAVELLDLVDRFEYEASASQKTEMSQFFGFALTENNRPIQSGQSFENVNLAVIVGEASGDDLLPRGFAYLEANPVQTWYVLSGGLQVSGLSSEVRTGLIIQSDKMWKACPEGMVLKEVLKEYSCTGDAITYNDENAARAAVIKANQAQDRIYSDWRLPSKQELSSLLDLKSEGRVFIRDPLKTRVSENIRLPFLTGTACSKPGRCESPWVVRFQATVGTDSTFVRPLSDEESFNLLLVRDAR